MVRLKYVVIISFIFVNFVYSQVTPFNHSSLHWKTIEGKHHIVHYHIGAERTAKTILSIAEEIHDPLVELYQYEPDTKVHWIVYDTDDYANGATYYLNNKIVIWAPALDFEFRGTHHWLRNVVTHEYTHMIQLGASRKWTRQVPAIYFQSVQYESETRSDVLYGFPNQIISYPIPNTIVPHWFAEGTAQSMRKGMNYDYWDSHREMLLRTRVLSNQLLTLEEMSVFHKNSLENELVYNQGFSITQYILQKYGEDALRKISKEMASKWNWSLNDQFKHSIGVTAEQLYQDWKKSLTEKYTHQVSPIRENLKQGRLIESEGFGNLYPKWSKDGEYIYYVSNKGMDYFSGSRIISYHIQTGKKEKLVSTAAPFAVHPVQNGIIYSSQPLQKGQRRLDDLFYYDINKKKSYRLTYQSRSQQPDISPDGKWLVAIDQNDGTMNLVLFALPETLTVKRKLKQGLKKINLTNFQNGEQLSRPRFSKDGKQIYFSYALNNNRDIYIYDLETKTLSPFKERSCDDRDVSMSQDWLYFSSDSTGIWNIYRYNLITGAFEQITNVIGGALLGEVSPDGRKLVYSQFESDGYKIALIDSIKPIQLNVNQTKSDFPIAKLSLNGSQEYLSNNYRPIFEKTFLLPRIAWDYGTFKPGFYLYTSDFLEKMNLIGAFSINRRNEYDIFFSADYRVLPSTLFLNVYNLVRRESKEFDDPFKIVGQIGTGDNAIPIYAKYGIEYKFNLLEAEVGTKYNLDEKTTLSLYSVISKYQTALKFSDGSPSFGYTYFKGKSAVFSFVHSNIKRTITSDIHPTKGYQLGVKVQRNNHNFIEGFKINADKLTLQEVFTPYNYWQSEFVLQYFQKIWRSWTVVPSAKVGWVDRNVDPFFYLYAGGLYGMRGYSFYSLGGRKTIINQFASQVPLWNSKGTKQILNWLTPTDLYFNLFSDVGTVWNNHLKNTKWVRDVGAELRFSAISFYSYPTAITFSAARGLDRVQVYENNALSTYPPQWRYYLTVLFGFTQPPTGIHFFNKRWK